MFSVNVYGSNNFETVEFQASLDRDEADRFFLSGDYEFTWTDETDERWEFLDGEMPYWVRAGVAE